MSHMDLPPPQLQGWSSCGSAALGTQHPLGHFATCSWGSLTCFYHQVTTEKLRLQYCVEPLLKRDFFLYNCGQNRMEIHLDNQVYFKCWHWALLSRIHVQTQNFQQQQEQSNGDSQEVNLKAAEQFGEVTVTALQSKGSQTQVYCLESFRSRGVLFVYIPSNFLLTVIWKNPVGRIWGRLQKHQEVLSSLDCCKSLKGQKIFLRKILSGGKAEDGEKLQR